MPFLPGSQHHNYIHGHALASGYSGAYKSWSSMIDRCSLNRATPNPYYAGIGITVCDEWKSSFMSFFEYMGDRPEGCSIDRIDPYGNYEPGNCRWATAKQQSRNKRVNPKHKSALIVVNFLGEEIPAIDLAIKNGIPLSTMYRRIWQGYSGEELINKESKLKLRNGEKCPSSKLTSDDVIAIKNELANGSGVCSIARRYGVSQPTVSNIKSGATWGHISQPDPEAKQP